jgi:rhodanese-related sulfurtransferase
MQLLRHLVVLLASGSLLGLGLNAASPRPIALTAPVYAAAESGAATCSAPHDGAAGAPAAFRSIAWAEASAMCSDCTAGFVDARPASEFAEGHIPNAVHLPPHAAADEAQALQALRGFGTLVVYDSGYACDLAETVGKHLREEGFMDVRILDGAWPAWMKAGGPAESGACQACAHPGDRGAHP